MTRSLRLYAFVIAAAAICFVFTEAFAFSSRSSTGISIRTKTKDPSIAIATSRFSLVTDNDSDENPSSRETLQIDSRSDTNRPLFLLYGIDALMFLIFAALGKASHSTASGFQWIDIASTAAPFLAAWFVTSPFTGVFNDLEYKKDTDATENNIKNDNGNGVDIKTLVLASLGQTAKGWAVAVPLGCVARGIVKGCAPPVPFVVVTLIATLILLSGSRALFAVLTTNLSKKQEN